MPRSPIKTRKSTIAEYWLDTDEGRARLPDNVALMDCGEPSCFACGWMAADPDLEPRLWSVWNQSSLQRCHLVPDALGGSDEPSNLVLLCARCHREAPDVGDPEYMLRWIAAHESWASVISRAIEAALEQAGATTADIKAYDALGVRASVDLHRSIMSDWAVPVGGAFSYSTLAACAVEGVRRAASGTERVSPSTR